MTAATLRFGIGLFFAAGILARGASGQEQAPTRGSTEMSLHKSVQVRMLGSREVSGEERRIGPGDSLWRILIEEKGLPEKKFQSYLVVIRGLNPQVKNLDLLRIGDKVSIPLRPDDIRSAPTGVEATTQSSGSAALAETFRYRVKAGESLYRILREQFKLSDVHKLAQYASLVKDLNPERQRDWDQLHEGEVLRLPALGRESETVSAESDVAPSDSQKSAAGLDAAAVAKQETMPSATPMDADQVVRAPARVNMPLVTKIVEAIGSEIESTGEEVIKLPDGTVHFDRSAYPVIYNPTVRQKVVIDPGGDIPKTLKTKLNDPAIGTPVVPVTDGVSLQEAVKQLLIALGYQPLPAGRPVVVQQAGITFEAKGSWMALAPEINNKPQDVLVINVTNHPGDIPNYLRAELARQGLTLRDVALSGNGVAPGPDKSDSEPDRAPQIIEWPTDKQALVDTLLTTFGVSFRAAETLSVELREGLRVDIRADRLFDVNGKRTALFFQRADSEIRKALEQRQNVAVAELDLASLSSRELIGHLLGVLGEPTVYGEHRFPAAQNSNRDRLALRAWGFKLTKKEMFVTDRQIPSPLHRFFFEKGLKIVYFR
ncbi:MAG: hypothetical protein ACM3SP_18270 [Chloroflexota bacterium]